jgi:hypothetical protein
MLFDENSYLVKKEKIPASLISQIGKSKYFTLTLPKNYSAIITANIKSEQ